MTPDAAIPAVVSKAKQKLAAARDLLAAGHWDDASSRAYYAAFHAVTAVLLARGLTFSSHGQLIGAFNRECVKTGEFTRADSRVLRRLAEDREIGDYGVSLPVDEAAARLDVEDATRLVARCLEHLEQRLGPSMSPEPVENEPS